MVHARFGGLTFWGGDEQTGFTMDDEALKGWFRGVDVKRDELPRPRAAGSFDTDVFLDSRVVAISGLCLADNERSLNLYGQKLTALLAAGSQTMEVRMPWGSTEATGRAIETNWDVLVWGAIARYQLLVWFPNPRKFGAEYSYGPGPAVSAFHYGNHAADPVFTVSSSAGIGTGYTINGPDGEEFTVTEPVAAGVPHVIENGLLYIDGEVVYDKISSGDTWTIPAGSAVSQTLVPVSGSGTLTVTVRDTFV